MRLRTIPLLVVIIAVVAALGAWTDKPRVQVSDAPAVIEATKPWDAVVKVTRRGRSLAGYKAVLTLVGPRGTRARAGEGARLGPLPHPGPHAARGFYSYTITVGDRVAARGTVYAIPR